MCLWGLKSKFRYGKNDGHLVSQVMCPARLWPSPWKKGSALERACPCAKTTWTLKGQRLGAWWGWDHEGRGSEERQRKGQDSQLFVTTAVCHWYLLDLLSLSGLIYWWYSGYTVHSQILINWPVDGSFFPELTAKAPEKIKPLPKKESSSSNFEALVLQLWISGVLYKCIILSFLFEMDRWIRGRPTNAMGQQWLTNPNPYTS